MCRILIAVLLCCGLTVFGQVPGLGPCFNANPQSTLNLTQYLGKWYEITKLPSFFEINQVCITANYSVKENGHIKVFNQGISNGKNVTSIGDAFIPDSNKPSELKVQFSEGPYANYWVLETDYTSYSVVLSCTNLTSVAHVQFAWILSRTPSLDQTLQSQLEQKLMNNGVPTSDLKPTPQNWWQKIKEVEGLLDIASIQIQSVLVEPHTADDKTNTIETNNCELFRSILDLVKLSKSKLESIRCPDHASLVTQTEKDEFSLNLHQDEDKTQFESCLASNANLIDGELQFMSSSVLDATNSEHEYNTTKTDDESVVRREITSNETENDSHTEPENKSGSTTPTDKKSGVIFGSDSNGTKTGNSVGITNEEDSDAAKTEGESCFRRTTSLNSVQSEDGQLRTSCSDVVKIGADDGCPETINMVCQTVNISHKDDCIQTVATVMKHVCCQTINVITHDNCCQTPSPCLKDCCFQTERSGEDGYSQTEPRECFDKSTLIDNHDMEEQHAAQDQEISESRSAGRPRPSHKTRRAPEPPLAEVIKRRMRLMTQPKRCEPSHTIGSALKCPPLIKTSPGTSSKQDEEQIVPDSSIDQSNENSIVINYPDNLNPFGEDTNDVKSRNS